MTPRDVVLPPVEIDPDELAQRLMAPAKPKPPYKVIAHRTDWPLKIGEAEFPCFVLENGKRVLSQRSVMAAVGFSRRHLHAESDGSEIAGFEPPKWLKSFIHADLLMALKSPIPFTGPSSGAVVYGYETTILPAFCNAVLDAHEQGKTTSRQQPMIAHIKTLARALMNVALIALVDEATGYQRTRDEQELAAILKAYLAEELQPWTRTFPYEFYELLYELRGWGRPDANGKRGSQVARDTVDLVYTRLNKGVYEELQRRTARLETGELKWRPHRWFTPNYGYDKLQRHIEGVMALMRAVARGSADWREFKTLLNRSYEKLRDPRQFDLDLEQKPQRDLPNV